MRQPDLFSETPRRVKPMREAATEVVREKARRASNKTRVLLRLQQGPATTMELIAVGGARAPARVWELKRDGWPVIVTDEGHGLFRYALTGKT